MERKCIGSPVVRCWVKKWEVAGSILGRGAWVDFFFRMNFRRQTVSLPSPLATKFFGRRMAPFGDKIFWSPYGSPFGDKIF